MSIYAISDLHLALGIDKPMDVFGERWTNYMDKLKREWTDTVSEGDFVVVPGDISWATYLEQAFEDFRFINGLPGKKIISKGNHDYWWTTLSKLNKFMESNEFSTIEFMHNNSFHIESAVICGTRGWKCPGDDDFSAEDRKIYNRELQRLELSLKSLSKTREEAVIVALHYSPFNSKRQKSEFIDILKKYEVKTCVYGHLHGESCNNAVEGWVDDIDFKLISSDHLNFKPLLLVE
jgi:predicted phosphohydrolase